MLDISRWFWNCLLFKTFAHSRLCWDQWGRRSVARSISSLWGNIVSFKSFWGPSCCCWWFHLSHQDHCQDHHQEDHDDCPPNLITGILVSPAFCWTTSRVVAARVSSEVNAIVGLIIIICRWMDFDSSHRDKGWEAGAGQIFWQMFMNCIFIKWKPEPRGKKCFPCSFRLSLTKFWKADIDPTTEPEGKIQNIWMRQCRSPMNVICWLWAQSKLEKGQQHLSAKSRIKKRMKGKVSHLLSLFHWLSPCLRSITVCFKSLPPPMQISSPIWKSDCMQESFFCAHLKSFHFCSLLWRFAGWIVRSATVGSSAETLASPPAL